MPAIFVVHPASVCNPSVPMSPFEVEAYFGVRAPVRGSAPAARAARAANKTILIELLECYVCLLVSQHGDSEKAALEDARTNI